MSQVTYDLHDQVVIVTGAARGVGRAIVSRFVQAGAKVLAADREGDGLAETVEAHSDGVFGVTADISTPQGVDAIVSGAVDQFGRLDVCVNNAAVAPHASLMDERVEVWDTVYGVNCRGTFLMTQAAGKIMIHQGDGGRIINFSSGVSRRGSAGAAAYASSRAATEAFSRVAAIELAPHGILVNAVSPGPTARPPEVPEGEWQRIVARAPLRRESSDADIAELVATLLKLETVTGENVRVDSGRHLAGNGG